MTKAVARSVKQPRRAEVMVMVMGMGMWEEQGWRVCVLNVLKGDRGGVLVKLVAARGRRTRSAV